MNHVYPLTACDFYKTGHRQQYPTDTTLVVSNFTPRSGRHANIENNTEIVSFGLQYFIKDFLIESWNKGFFNLPKEKVIGWYRRRLDTSLGKDSVPVDHVEALHDLGYLPIEIRALVEGTIVPVGIPILTLHNTKPEFFWLTNYLETILSAYLWLPCTSATTARGYRKLIEKYSALTGSPEWFMDIQGHDFSFRGLSSLQAAMMSGAGHLLSFTGTDTIPAIDFLERYYGANADKEMIGCSIPATEHSVMCAGGEEDEIGTFSRLMEIYPTGLLSIVSDTWDFWKVLTEYAPALKDKIMGRSGKIVFRPDSGDPVKILCGHGGIEKPEWEAKGAVEVLWDTFGGTYTATGHKLLDGHVGLIYGDSISYARAEEILQRLEAKGFAAANIVFGIGSYTYQYVTRDTWGWAVKATYVEVNGVGRNIYKKPKTDTGEKNSAKGLLFIEKDPNGKLYMKQEVSWEEFNSPENLLAPVFRDGKILREETLSGIRARLKTQ